MHVRLVVGANVPFQEITYMNSLEPGVRLFLHHYFQILKSEHERCAPLFPSCTSSSRGRPTSATL